MNRVAIAIAMLLASCGIDEHTVVDSVDASVVDHPDASALTQNDAANSGFELCAPVEGTQDVIVIPVLFRGSQEVACTPDALHEIWFGASASVGAFYQEASAGRMSLVGSVASPVTIDPIDGCITSDHDGNIRIIRSLKDRVEETMTEAGLDPPPTALRVHVIPESIRCAGPKGASYPRYGVFLYGDSCASQFISVHEVGHILGINHSSSVESGIEREVGDGSDFMGNGLFAPNGPHRAQLGWLPLESMVVAESGRYRLHPLSEESNDLRLLVIDRPNSDQAIYLSYRLDIGLPAAYLERTSVHEFVDQCPQKQPVPKTRLLGSIGNGEEIAIDGLSIRQVSNDSMAAEIEINAH